VDEARLPKAQPGADRLGPYMLVERLGTGGMGAVYRALNERIGRTVAVKLLHRSLLGDRVAISRFFHEARAVNTIRHPNVVEVYDLATDGETHYMVMELLRGRDLETLLESNPGGLPPDRVALIVEQVCGALQEAHARQILHRDLKPPNVFLCRKGPNEDFVKLLDFGVAKLQGAGGARLTMEGVTLGTPEYMAPEQARGAPIDNRSDLYAVGCMTYQALTGQLPFGGGHATDVMVRHVTQPPPPLRKWRPDLPEAVEAVVLRCMAKDPAERPQTAQELAELLCAAAGVPFDTTGAFMSWKQWSQETSTLRSLARARTVTQAVPQVGRGRRPLLLGAAGLGVATIAAGLLRSRGAARPDPSATAVSGAPPRPAPAAPPAVVPTEAAEAAPELPVVKLLLQSSPPGARVDRLDGLHVGTTPHTLTAPVGTVQEVRFTLPGHESETRALAFEADGTVAVALAPIEPPAPPRPGAARPGPRGARAASGTASAPRATGAAASEPRLPSSARTIDPF
jgi:serine/threonine-protein kinase